jgi:hypothetical protein
VGGRAEAQELSRANFDSTAKEDDATLAIEEISQLLPMTCRVEIKEDEIDVDSRKDTGRKLLLESWKQRSHGRPVATGRQAGAETAPGAPAPA